MIGVLSINLGTMSTNAPGWAYMYDTVDGRPRLPPNKGGGRNGYPKAVSDCLDCGPYCLCGNAVYGGGPPGTTAIGAVAHGLAEGLRMGLIWFFIIGAVQFIFYRFRMR